MHFSLYLIPFIGAFIGWLSAALAILLIFYPGEPLYLGFFSIQGIVPKYSKIIAKKLAAAFAEEFSLEEWLQERLTSPNVHQDVLKLIDSRLDGLIDNLKHQIPMGALFLKGALAENLKRHATDELMKMLPEIPQALGKHLSLDDISNNFLDQPVNPARQQKIEEVITNLLKPDLIRITMVGALLGFFLGFVQVMLHAIAF